MGGEMRKQAGAGEGLGMIIVAGWLRVAAVDRDTYLEQCRAVVRAARDTPGCVAFSLSADVLDDERINIFEQWESVGALERFRDAGPDDGLSSMILQARVWQHEVATSVDLA